MVPFLDCLGGESCESAKLKGSISVIAVRGLGGGEHESDCAKNGAADDDSEGQLMSRRGLGERDVEALGCDCGADQQLQYDEDENHGKEKTEDVFHCRSNQG